MLHGTHGMVWLNYFAKATTSPPTFNRKPAVWHSSHPFLSVLNKKIFIYTPQSNSLAGKVKLKCFQNGTQCLNFGLGPRTFYFGLRQRLHVWQSNRQSSSQSKALFRHYRINQTDANKFHISFIFFKTFLPFSLPEWSNDLPVENLAVNFKIHLCNSGVTTENASFRVCASRWSQQLTSYPNRCSPFQIEMQIMARLRVLVWKPFRCHLEGRVRLSLEACGTSCTRASCQGHYLIFISTGEKWK